MIDDSQVYQLETQRPLKYLSGNTVIGGVEDTKRK